jgi:predicted metal-binding protein
MPAAEIIVCTTCRGPGGVAGTGAAFAAGLAALAADPAYGRVAVTPAACLWSCGQGASAQLRAATKTGYVMGGFVAADAAALLDFARAYAASADGEVPYDRWPAGVLGHFIARTPPPGGGFS